MKHGLTVLAHDGAAAKKSSNFGVFSRGDGGHRQTNGDSEQE